MRSDGQAIALQQLERIANVEASALRIDHVDDASNQAGWLAIDISLDCTHYERAADGLDLHTRESVRLSIPRDFPYQAPVVTTAHTRFLGFPHVQWGTQLCLYQSQETQWQPSLGMVGLIDQLDRWFQKAALNELDDPEGPLHPPVAYIGSANTICVQANTPSRDRWPWFGAAELVQRKTNFLDLVGWHDIREVAPGQAFAPALLLDFELPFEYPQTVQGLLKCLEKHGVETSRVLVHMMLVAERITSGEPMHVVIGAPSRGIAGDHENRLQHVSVWEIDPVDTLNLQAVALACALLNRSQGDELSEKIQAIIDSVFADLVKWQRTSRVRWCTVLENRPEIVTRRDEGTAMHWFTGKHVALWGCGALGGQIAEHLVRAGVSGIKLYDAKRVHPGILVRQNFVEQDINDGKAAALKRRLDTIAPQVNITAHTEDVVRDPLNGPDWQRGVDIVIDTTASLLVRSKLEAVLKNQERRVPTAAMMISGAARHGAMVLAPVGYSGGPLDAYRRLGLAATNRTWLVDWVSAFWERDTEEPMRQPEPGCSDPTFVASHADIAGLAARMLNSLAIELTQETSKAAGVLFSAEPARKRDAVFHFSPDIVVNGRKQQFRVAASVWRDVRGWIRSGARERTPEDETGGLVFGQLDETLGIAWLSNVSGPPQDSCFSPERFVCGTDGTRKLSETYDEHSRGMVRYIGTWHSHPRSPATPSSTDYAGIASIFATNPGQGAHQLMMIVGNSAQSDAELGLYVYEKRTVRICKESAVAEIAPDGGRRQAPPIPASGQSIGLALSGGGSRAVAFHLGTLRALEDLGFLDEIQVLSGVSGGAVMAGLLGYTNEDFQAVDKKTAAFLKRGLVWPSFKKLSHPVRLFQALTAFVIVTVPAFLLNLFRRITLKLFSFLPGNSRVNRRLGKIRWPIPLWYSHTHVMRDAIADLVGTRSCAEETRHGMSVVLNACELRTSTAFRMSNEHYGSWRYGWASAHDLPLADAITASAAYPSLLPPFEWKKTFAKSDGRQRRRVLVTDGGVFENMGVSVLEPGRDPAVSLVGYSPSVIIASDASVGQLAGADLPASWTARMTQAFSSVMRKVNDATKQRLHRFAEEGQIDGFLYVHLGQMDARVPLKPPNWIERGEVVDYPTDFSSMSDETIRGLSGRGEALTRALATQYLLSD